MVKTIAVIGFPRCGTTMVAGILQILGVQMVGDNYKPDKWEDIDLINSISDENEFSTIVEKRNESEIWGFKHPGAYWHLDILVKYLRNPVYLFIWKDPASVSRRRYRTGSKSNQKLVYQIRNTLDRYIEAIDSISKSGQSINMLSYSDAVISPGRFVRQIVSIADIPTNEQYIETATKFIQPNTKLNRAEYYPLVTDWI